MNNIFNGGAYNMCMKGININNLFYEDNLTGFNDNLKFGDIKEQIKVIRNSSNKYIISRLYILCTLNAMSTKEDNDLTSVYDVMWTFGFVNSDNIFDNKKIAETTLDTSVNKINDNTVSTRLFSNQIRIIELKDYLINKTGRCYLKTYIKKKYTEDNWQIQSITTIDIVD